MNWPAVIEPSAPSGMARLQDNDPLAPTIFHLPWWLEIATGGRYSMVEATQNGRVVGRMPYFPDRRFGSTLSRMPPLTHFLGPAIDDGEGGANTRFLRKLMITRELIRKLPSVPYFSQKFYRGITDVLAFQIEGYESSIQFTHEIAPRPEAEIWAGMRDKTRNMVRKAAKQFVCTTLDDPDAFIRMYTANLKARQKKVSINLPVCQKLAAACLARDCGRLYVARRDDGTPAAAAFCAWDATSAYYLMSTRTIDSGNSAATLLLWQAIKDAMARGLVFDFDGVPSTGAVLFYAGFGAAIQPRYIVSNASKLMHIVNTMRLMVVTRSKFF